MPEQQQSHLINKSHKVQIVEDATSSANGTTLGFVEAAIKQFTDQHRKTTSKCKEPAEPTSFKSAHWAAA